MFKLFFKLFQASFKTDKVFSILNILGLSIGICSSLLIYLWVTDEMSFDRFHKNANNIYRILKVEKVADGEINSARTPAPLAFELKNNFPQIIKAASIYEGSDKSILYNNSITKFNVAYTSNELFEMFDFPVIYQSAQSLFANEKSVVISNKCAKKLFGDENPIGKKIECFFYKSNIYEISAVVEIPTNSHLQFEILVPFGSDETVERIRQQWNVIDAVNYIEVVDNAGFDNKQKLRLQNFLLEKTDKDIKLFFQPLPDIHLFTEFNDDSTQNNGNIQYVRVFSMAALFLLIVAGLNYIILSTARSEKRNKEIALKKLFGLNKFLLIGQFLFETIIFTLIAQLIALIFFYFVLPYFNELTGKSIDLQFDFNTIFYFIVSPVVMSLLAGGYLSFYLSSLEPLNLLNGISKRGSKYHLTTIISSFQLLFSFIFILCSINIYQQLRHMKNKDTGMQLDNIVAVNTQGFIYQIESIKKELLTNTNIYSVTASGGAPINYNFERKGIDWEGKKSKDNFSFSILTVDPSYLETFDIHLLQGSGLPQNMTVDGHFEGKYNFKAPIIINESALSLMGIVNPIGKKIDLGYPAMNGFIAGVVSDFHFKPMNYKIPPMAMGYDPENFSEMYVKINPEKKKEAIKFIEEVTLPYTKGKYLFDYYFVKDKMNLLYKAEKNMSYFAFIFAFISVFISLLGIIDMIFYSIARQKKNITIRKVYGAEMKDILRMYIKESSIIVSLAFIIAAAVSWYYLQSWLDNYAYRISLSPLLFLGVFLIVLFVIVLITIKLVYGEANKNPVTNLHYE